MPTLNKVCVWQVPFLPSEVWVFISGSPNVYFENNTQKNILKDNVLQRTSGNNFSSNSVSSNNTFDNTTLP